MAAPTLKTAKPSSFIMQQQEADDWCWAAVAVSVQKYLAPDAALTQGQLASRVLPGCNGDPNSAVCNLPASLTQVLNLLHRQSADPLPTPISFAQIRQTIDSGWPIPVRIVWDENPGNAHFVVISGYAISRSGIPLLQVDDPFYDRSIVDYDTFVSSYHGAGQWEQTYRVG
jgi:hypothetical protein